MINNVWIGSYLKVRMLHKEALDDRVKKLLLNAWNDLTKHEMRLVMRHKAIATVVAEHVGDLSSFKRTAEQFDSYLGELVEWVYIIERIGVPGICAFMAVTKDQQILSLFVSPGYRRNKLGVYLVKNHLEIFGKSVSLQCFKFNDDAIRFYHNLGFKASYIANRDDHNDLYDTLVFML